MEYPIFESKKGPGLGEILLAPAKSIEAVMQIISNLPEGSDERGDFARKSRLMKVARTELIADGVESKEALRQYQAISSALFPARISDLRKAHWVLDISVFTSDYIGINSADQSAWSALVMKGTGYSVIPAVKQFVEQYAAGEKEAARAQAQKIYRTISSLKGVVQYRLIAMANAGDPRRIFADLRNSIADAGTPDMNVQEARENQIAASQTGREAAARIRTAALNTSSLVYSALSLEAVKDDIARRLNNVDYLLSAVGTLATEASFKEKSDALGRVQRLITPRLVSSLETDSPDLASKFSAVLKNATEYQESVQKAVYSEFDKLISASSVTDEEAQAWISGLTLPAAAKKMFMDEGGSRLEAELVKLYKLSGGSLSAMKGINVKSGRAHASYSTGFVTIAKTDGLDVLWHEVAHFIEYSNPSLLAMAREFLRSKAGDPPRYVAIGGSGRKVEMGVQAAFSTPYIGRVYGDKTIDGTDATEVFSMGIQMALNGHYGSRSAAADDGVLDFVIGALKGLQERTRES